MSARFEQRVPVGLFLTDEKGMGLSVNECFGDLTGLSRDEALGDGWVKALHPDDRERILRSWSESVAQRKGFHDQFRFRNCQSGEDIWVQAQASLHTDEDGKFIGFVGSVTDITQLVLAQTEAARARSSLAEAQRIARVGNWDWEIESGTLWWSNEVYRIFGVTPSETATTYEAFLARVHPDDRVEVEAALSESLASLSPYAVDHRVVQPDGTVLVVHEQGEVLCDESGKAVRMVGTVQDVTHARRVEAELQNKHRLEAMGRLAGGIAHDFNNLLQIVQTYLFLVESCRGDDESRSKYLAEIGRAVEAGAQLTRQLLVFGRSEQRLLETIDVNAVVQSLSRMLGHLMPPHLQLQLELASEGALVQMTPGHLEQMLLNLSLNARDAMPEGGVLGWRIRSVDVDGAGSQVEIVVSDTGTGIADEVLPFIFDPFFSTKAPGKGTGLGLSTVHGIVEDAGGSIDVQSSAVDGTQITIRLPTTRAHRNRSGEHHLPQPSVRPGATLLVVEDEDTVRAATTRVLAQAGYHVLQASDGLDALGLLKGLSEPPDLVISDLVMPRMRGAELLGHLAEHHPELPVLLISGFPDDDSLVDRLVVGHSKLIHKPVTPRRLLREIDALMRSNQESRPSEVEDRA